MYTIHYNKYNMYELYNNSNSLIVISNKLGLFLILRFNSTQLFTGS